jgi:hypothetical protein
MLQIEITRVSARNELKGGKKFQVVFKGVQWCFDDKTEPPTPNLMQIWMNLFIISP